MDGSLIRPTVSRATVDDIPWILSLAHERYEAFDPGRVLVFLLETLKAPTAIILKGDHQDAVLIASTVVPPWHPKRKECHVLFLFARPGAHWQAVKLLRACISWARLQGCVKWRFHSDTSHDVGALARRVGARENKPMYVLEL